MTGRAVTKCRKVRYRDRIAAALALAGKAGDVGSVRVYRCNLCRGWHTTSQPKRGKADR